MCFLRSTARRCAPAMRSIQDRKSSRVACSTDGRERGILFFILNFNLRFFSSPQRSIRIPVPVPRHITLNQFSLRSSRPRKSDPVRPSTFIHLCDSIQFIILELGIDAVRLNRFPLFRGMQVLITARVSSVISELILEAKRDVATRDRSAARITDVISPAYQTRARN